MISWLSLGHRFESPPAATLDVLSPHRERGGILQGVFMLQSKLVNPNGSLKATVAVHDRVASGKEFHLFSSLLGVMALGAIPTDKFDPAGHQMFELIEPEALIHRAERIVRDAMYAASNNGWTAETADINEIYEDKETGSAGFRPAPAQTPNLDDDIPF